MDLGNLRREYLARGLQRETLLADPIRQFEQWMREAIELEIPDPTAMVLATVGADAQPSQRIVLLKDLAAVPGAGGALEPGKTEGFVFYTNFTSRKATEILNNSSVSLLFPWHGINRQVKISGRARKISVEQSMRYFNSRPRESQLAAWTSRQSQPLASREVLMERLKKMQQRFPEGEVPLPDFWGGFIVEPSRVEFWQGAEHRLHDCFEYTRTGSGNWTIQRLAP